jgi:hypothetical protein
MELISGRVSVNFRCQTSNLERIKTTANLTIKIHEAKYLLKIASAVYARNIGLAVNHFTDPLHG